MIYTQYSGKVDPHAHKRYLTVDNIHHICRELPSPQTINSANNFHRTMKKEYYHIMFRKQLFDD